MRFFFSFFFSTRYPPTNTFISSVFAPFPLPAARMFVLVTKNKASPGGEKRKIKHEKKQKRRGRETERGNQVVKKSLSSPRMNKEISAPPSLLDPKSRSTKTMGTSASTAWDSLAALTAISIWKA